MLTRRALLRGGVLGGAVAGAAAGGRADASADAAGSEGSLGGPLQQSSRSSDTDEKTLKAIEEIRDLLNAANGGQVPELATIRQLQRDFLKGRGKFPDFIEIGVDIWDAVMNWHVRTRQAPLVTRMADGRYAVAVFQSNLILRHDVSNNYIGQPYDSK